MNITLSAEQNLVVADRGRLRIYRVVREPGQFSMGLSTVLSTDFPAGRSDYFEQDTDKAGRFPGRDGRSGGMSIDERLPLQREQERQIVAEVAGQIEAHLRQHPEVMWHLAAAPDFGKQLLERMERSVSERLLGTLERNLVGEPVDRLLKHFTS